MQTDKLILLLQTVQWRPLDSNANLIRCQTKRVSGHWKGRLRGLNVRKLSRIVSLIISGCILHNLCVLHYDDVRVSVDNDDNEHPNAYPNIYVEGKGEAKRHIKCFQCFIHFLWENNQIGHRKIYQLDAVIKTVIPARKCLTLNIYLRI